MTIPASPPGSRDPVDSASPNVAGHASADENGQGGKDEPDRQDSEESSAQPTDAEIKEMMKEYTV